MNANLNSIFSNKLILNFFLLLCVSLFFVYPEFYIIFSLFLIVYIFLHKKFLNIIKIEKYSFLYLLLLFLIFTLPSYETNYKIVISQIRIATNPGVNYWGYYGFFLIGNAIDLASRENIEFIKSIFLDNQGLLDLFPFIKEFFLSNGYYFVPINIIPSFIWIIFFYYWKNFKFSRLYFYFDYYFFKCLYINYNQKKSLKNI